MSKDSVSQFRMRAGGKWAVSWQAYFISLPFAFLAILSVLARRGQSVGEFSLALLATLITCLVMGMWVWMLMHLIFPHRQENPMTVVQLIGNGMLTGFLYWVCVAVSLRMLGLTDESGWQVRLISSMFVLPWWGTSLALLLEARERFATQRSTAMARAVQLEIAGRQGAQVIAQINESLATEMGNEFADAQSELEQAIDAAIGNQSAIDAQGWSKVSESLRGTAQQVVRPISNRLAATHTPELPVLKLWQIILNIPKFQPFRPIPIVLVYVLTTGLQEVDLLGLSTGGVRLVSEVLVIAAVMNIANFAMRRRPRLHAKIFIGTVYFFQVFDTYTLRTLTEAAALPMHSVQIVISIVTSIILILFTSGFGSFTNTASDMLHTFSSELDQHQIQIFAQNQQVAQVAAAASRVMHGQVQTKLVTCAAAIERASAAGDVEALNKALHEVRRVLEHPTFSVEAATDTTVLAALQEKCEPWVGLCDCVLHMPDEIAGMMGKPSQDLALILEEALSNAYRHGKASTVVVTISHLDAENLSITVLDDGIGPSGGKKSVGSALLEAISSSRVWLEEAPVGFGALLTVHVSISEVA